MQPKLYWIFDVGARALPGLEDGQHRVTEHLPITGGASDDGPIVEHFARASTEDEEHADVDAVIQLYGDPAPGRFFARVRPLLGGLRHETELVIVPART